MFPQIDNGIDENCCSSVMHVLDDLQDSNVFCVGTSAMREGLGEGEKHVVELQILLQNYLHECKE